MSMQPKSLQLQQQDTKPTAGGGGKGQGIDFNSNAKQNNLVKNEQAGQQQQQQQQQHIQLLRNAISVSPTTQSQQAISGRKMESNQVTITVNSSIRNLPSLKFPILIEGNPTNENEASSRRAFINLPFDPTVSKQEQNVQIEQSRPQTTRNPNSQSLQVVSNLKFFSSVKKLQKDQQQKLQQQSQKQLEIFSNQTINNNNNNSNKKDSKVQPTHLQEVQEKQGSASKKSKNKLKQKKGLLAKTLSNVAPGNNLKKQKKGNSNNLTNKENPKENKEKCKQLEQEQNQQNEQQQKSKKNTFESEVQESSVANPLLAAGVNANHKKLKKKSSLFIFSKLSSPQRQPQIVSPQGRTNFRASPATIHEPANKGKQAQLNTLHSTRVKSLYHLPNSEKGSMATSPKDQMSSQSNQVIYSNRQATSPNHQGASQNNQMTSVNENSIDGNEDIIKEESNQNYNVEDYTQSNKNQVQFQRMKANQHRTTQSLTSNPLSSKNVTQNVSTNTLHDSLQSSFAKRQKSDDFLSYIHENAFKIQKEIEDKKREEEEQKQQKAVDKAVLKAKNELIRKKNQKFAKKKIPSSKFIPWGINQQRLQKYFIKEMGQIGKRGDIIEGSNSTIKKIDSKQRRSNLGLDYLNQLNESAVQAIVLNQKKKEKKSFHQPTEDPIIQAQLQKKELSAEEKKNLIEFMNNKKKQQEEYEENKKRELREKQKRLKLNLELLKHEIKEQIQSCKGSKSHLNSHSVSIMPSTTTNVNNNFNGYDDTIDINRSNQQNKNNFSSSLAANSINVSHKPFSNDRYSSINNNDINNNDNEIEMIKNTFEQQEEHQEAAEQFQQCQDEVQEYENIDVLKSKSLFNPDDISKLQFQNNINNHNNYQENIIKDNSKQQNNNSNNMSSSSKKKKRTKLRQTKSLSGIPSQLNQLGMQIGDMPIPVSINSMNNNVYQPFKVPFGISPQQEQEVCDFIRDEYKKNFNWREAFIDAPIEQKGQNPKSKGKNASQTNYKPDELKNQRKMMGNLLNQNNQFAQQLENQLAASPIQNQLPYPTLQSHNHNPYSSVPFNNLGYQYQPQHQQNQYPFPEQTQYPQYNNYNNMPQQQYDDNNQMIQQQYNNYISNQQIPSINSMNNNPISLSHRDQELYQLQQQQQQLQDFAERKNDVYLRFSQLASRLQQHISNSVQPNQQNTFGNNVNEQSQQQQQQQLKQKQNNNNIIYPNNNMEEIQEEEQHDKLSSRERTHSSNHSNLQISEQQQQQSNTQQDGNSFEQQQKQEDKQQTFQNHNNINSSHKQGKETLINQGVYQQSQQQSQQKNSQQQFSQQEEVEKKEEDQANNEVNFIEDRYQGKTNQMQGHKVSNITRSVEDIMEKSSKDLKQKVSNKTEENQGTINKEGNKRYQPQNQPFSYFNQSQNNNNSPTSVVPSALQTPAEDKLKIQKKEEGDKKLRELESIHDFKQNPQINYNNNKGMNLDEELPTVQSGYSGDKDQQEDGEDEIYDDFDEEEQMIILDMAATYIQKIWRGYFTRRVIEDFYQQYAEQEEYEQQFNYYDDEDDEDNERIEPQDLLPPPQMISDNQYPNELLRVYEQNSNQKPLINKDQNYQQESNESLKEQPVQLNDIQDKSLKENNGFKAQNEQINLLKIISNTPASKTPLQRYDNYQDDYEEEIIDDQIQQQSDHQEDQEEQKSNITNKRLSSTSQEMFQSLQQQSFQKSHNSIPEQKTIEQQQESNQKDSQLPESEKKDGENNDNLQKWMQLLNQLQQFKNQGVLQPEQIQFIDQLCQQHNNNPNNSNNKSDQTQEQSKGVLSTPQKQKYSQDKENKEKSQTHEDEEEEEEEQKESNYKSPFQKQSGLMNTLQNQQQSSSSMKLKKSKGKLQISDERNSSSKQLENISKDSEGQQQDLRQSDEFNDKSQIEQSLSKSILSNASSLSSSRLKDNHSLRQLPLEKFYMSSLKKESMDDLFKMREEVIYFQKKSKIQIIKQMLDEQKLSESVYEKKKKDIEEWMIREQHKLHKTHHEIERGWRKFAETVRLTKRGIQLMKQVKSNDKQSPHHHKHHQQQQQHRMNKQSKYKKLLSYNNSDSDIISFNKQSQSLNQQNNRSQLLLQPNAIDSQQIKIIQQYRQSDTDQLNQKANSLRFYSQNNNNNNNNNNGMIPYSNQSLQYTPANHNNNSRSFTSWDGQILLTNNSEEPEFDDINDYLLKMKTLAQNNISSLKQYQFQNQSKLSSGGEANHHYFASSDAMPSVSSTESLKQNGAQSPTFNEKNNKKQGQKREEDISLGLESKKKIPIPAEIINQSAIPIDMFLVSPVPKIQETSTDNIHSSEMKQIGLLSPDDIIAQKTPQNQQSHSLLSQDNLIVIPFPKQVSIINTNQNSDCIYQMKGNKSLQNQGNDNNHNNNNNLIDICNGPMEDDVLSPLDFLSKDLLGSPKCKLECHDSNNQSNNSNNINNNLLMISTENNFQSEVEKLDSNQAKFFSPLDEINNNKPIDNDQDKSSPSKREDIKILSTASVSSPKAIAPLATEDDEEKQNEFDEGRDSNEHNHSQESMTSDDKVLPIESCQNLNSIKDFLVALAEFIKENFREEFLLRVNQPLGIEALEFLKTFNITENTEPQETDASNGPIYPIVKYIHVQKPVVSEEIFLTFNELYQRMLRRQKKLEQQLNDDSSTQENDLNSENDEDEEIDIFNSQSDIEKYNLKLVFDCFNESLDFLRPFSLAGKPMPWKLNQKKIHTLHIQDPHIEKILGIAIARMLKWGSSLCGFISEKIEFPSGKEEENKEYLNQIKEDRLAQMLENEVVDNENRWLIYEEEETDVQLEIADDIFHYLMSETAQWLYLKMQGQLELMDSMEIAIERSHKQNFDEMVENEEDQKQLLDYNNSISTLSNKLTPLQKSMSSISIKKSSSQQLIDSLNEEFKNESDEYQEQLKTASRWERRIAKGIQLDKQQQLEEQCEEYLQESNEKNNKVSQPKAPKLSEEEKKKRAQEERLSKQNDKFLVRNMQDHLHSLPQNSSQNQFNQKANGQSDHNQSF